MARRVSGRSGAASGNRGRGTRGGRRASEMTPPSARTGRGALPRGMQADTSDTVDAGMDRPGRGRGGRGSRRMTGRGA
jgi:hypothetical protein